MVEVIGIWTFQELLAPGFICNKSIPEKWNSITHTRDSPINIFNNMWYYTLQTAQNTALAQSLT